VRTAKVRIYDPVRLGLPKLRVFAFQAAWIATLAETVDDLDDLLVDLPPDERLLPAFTMPWPWDFDSMALARSLVQASRDAATKDLRDLLATWFGEDPEHWPVLRLSLIDPWQETPGSWSADTPEWVRTLGTTATIAHEHDDPVGRRPPV
jgi:hypothetical protein